MFDHPVYQEPFLEALFTSDPPSSPSRTCYLGFSVRRVPIEVADHLAERNGFAGSRTSTVRMIRYQGLIIDWALETAPLDRRCIVS